LTGLLQCATRRPGGCGDVFPLSFVLFVGRVDCPDGGGVAGGNRLQTSFAHADNFVAGGSQHVDRL